ncbi:3' terminal RNA ribose 2'-O-methyltransferase Hen1 [Aliiroseovarius halocynthiae]|uniref:Small RNA 2'-O-methyltransferase n=1 Tax=Aliiroseovarius halocynthiae TaxID=985055 RepID=A0A545SUS9_9RHOB|nr:3' terminal RNA ribose 2'-O-methyltransferase Hen1 [Aliiroseovarius halocynthiae]TQV68724.1 3' terminal RNA ribose 2'-O-methyltransferase Hen1 [Aliiroseovarius halocynthiae]SMR71145.1 3' terminal RNA ribose 2'-O-methyltransferase Hen1 [Aliiroseovarius halocynthiae]
MQLEITLTAPTDADYAASDLGFLLHKHPDHLHTRSTSVGEVSIFYPQKSAERSTAVMHLEVDPVGLVRGKNQHSDGLLAQYVNDRPFVASSFLSVAMGRSFAQSMAGKSKDRQALADRALPFEIRVLPVALAGDLELLQRLFAPLGYRILSPTEISEDQVIELRLSATIRLADLLKHLYVLVPVLDNFKHYYVSEEEIEKLLAKGEGWLSEHPDKELITRRALKHRKSLMHMALARLEDTAPQDEEPEIATKAKPEEQLEKPLRLHALRLDTVAEVLKQNNVSSVLDLGCGEGKLMSRLIKERGLSRIVGVDASVRTLERAHRKLRLHQAGDAMSERVSLQMGSLTYGDRRWKGFDAATLVEVIEHIEPHRLSALAMSLFADARPQMVIMTTPNREYNVLFEGLKDGKLRHPDHRFEWTRAEFESWANIVAEEHGYRVSFTPLGPVDDTHGGPSQMAVFKQEG